MVLGFFDLPDLFFICMFEMLSFRDMHSLVQTCSYFAGYFRKPYVKLGEKQLNILKEKNSKLKDGFRYTHKDLVNFLCRIGINEIPIHYNFTSIIPTDYIGIVCIKLRKIYKKNISKSTRKLV